MYMYIIDYVDPVTISAYKLQILIVFTKCLKARKMYLQIIVILRYWICIVLTLRIGQNDLATCIENYLYYVY